MDGRKEGAGREERRDKRGRDKVGTKTRLSELKILLVKVRSTGAEVTRSWGHLKVS